MESKRRVGVLVATALIVAALVVGICLTGGSGGEEESIQVTMRDAVLHETNRIALFGLEVNPGLISAFTVTGLLLVAAALIRVFAIPRFKLVPGEIPAAAGDACGDVLTTSRSRTARTATAFWARTSSARASTSS